MKYTTQKTFECYSVKVNDRVKILFSEKKDNIASLGAGCRLN